MTDYVKILDERLHEKGWAHKRGLYAPYIERIEPLREVESPCVSIIVISWRLHPDNLKSFQILEQQRGESFELIFVDNGGKEGEFDSLRPYVDTYVRLNTNTGAYLARNIGALFTKAPILLFLEDDGIPEKNLVRAHLDLFAQYDIIACRGLYVPKTDNPLNKQQGHYYVGDKEYPTFAHVEGNTTYRADLFFKVGGWDDEIRFGGGGLELYFRLLTVEPDRRKQIYSPAPVIYHDYVSDTTHLKNKLRKQADSQVRLRKIYPLWDDAMKHYRLNIGRDDLLIQKGGETAHASGGPAVSIILMAGSDPDSAMKTLSSLAGQDLSGTETIMAYPASNHAVQEWVSSPAKPGIACVQVDADEEAMARNQAMEKAAGRYILWLKPGVEFVDTRAVSRFKEEIRDHFDADIVYSRTSGPHQPWGVPGGASVQDWYKRNEELAQALGKGVRITTDVLLVRKNLYSLEGPYRSLPGMHCEEEFVSRIASKKIYNLKLIDEVLSTAAPANGHGSPDRASQEKARGVSRVLFVNHNIYPHEISGTPLSTHNHALGMSQKGMEVAVLIPDREVKAGFRKERLRQYTLYRIPALDKLEAYCTGPLRDDLAGYRDGVERVVEDFCPQVVHINDYVFMPVEIIEAFSRKGCMVVRNVCNLEEFCHQDSPVLSSGLDGRLCPGPRSPDTCADCFDSLPATPSRGKASPEQSRSVREGIKIRFEQVQKVYRDGIDKVIFTSEPFREYFTRFVPIPKEKTTVIPRGFSFDFPRGQNRRKRPGGIVHFAFIGNIVFSKGIDVVLRAFEKACTNHDFVLHVYGWLVNAEYDTWIRRLQRRHPDRFIYHGHYKGDDLPEIASNTDVCIVPSYFDTYNRVVREFLYLGVPVIATDFFGASIVEDGRNGFRVPLGDSDALKAKMIELIDNPSLIEDLSRGAAETRIPGLEEEIDRLVETYNGLYTQLSGKKKAMLDTLIASRETQEQPAGRTARLIAFYLPQYHPIPENNQWWGEGFTEWTNVAKARPLFPGHYQPHLPADLGFYDLRLPETREAQAELARRYGISGFCYYHYWFHGKRLLNRVLDEVLDSGKPDFPFCICWANENWTRVWDGGDRKILMRQRYSEQDDQAHIAWLIRAFRDPRYIKVQGRPLLMIYRTSNLPDPEKTAALWREEVKKAGFPDLYLCTVESFTSEHMDPSRSGFDASVEFQPDWSRLGEKRDKYPNLHVFDYAEIMEKMMDKPAAGYKRFSCVTPCWDNSPRRNTDGYIFHGSKPGLYERWLRHALSGIRRDLPEDEHLVFVNAWNEWAEGNHLEPDQRFGHAYLEATRRALTIPAETIRLNEETTRRAERALEADHLDDAESLFQEALAHDPDAPRTLHQYAILQHVKGNAKEAITLLEKALRADPDNAEIMNDLGTVNFQAGRTNQAFALFNQAIALDPSQKAARMNLADMYAQAGLAAAAERIYREILASFPDDAEARDALSALRTATGRAEENPVRPGRVSETEPGSTHQNLSPAPGACSERKDPPRDHTFQNGICNICGSNGGFSLTNPKNPRESWVCLSCGSTSRDRMYIYALSSAFANLNPLINWPENTSISVLEASGARAHPGILKTKFTYLNTRYDPKKMADPGYDRKRYADLQALHFDDNSFDVVMSSDVFEHIRLHKEALKEIFRVLKPGGIMVLQAPFHPENKETIIRVRPEGDEDVFLCPPTYHDEDTLVYRVYGAEFISEIRSAGFVVEVIEDEVPLHCITRQNIILAQKPAAGSVPAGKGLDRESSRMKHDWNARAEENARYYIHSTEKDQTEDDFDASGRQNVQSLIIDDLPTIAVGIDPKTMVALEIGCGIGRMTRHLAGVFRDIHGVDVSGEMIRLARERLADLPNAHCYETGGTDLSIFPDAMFDFVFSFIVFQHIPSRDVILNYIHEAHRVLKTGGVFKFQVQGCIDPHWMRSEKDTWHGVTITEQDIDRVSRKLGFELLAKSGQGTQYSWYTLKKSSQAPKAKQRPLASIVIPVFNQMEYTRQCLDALKRHTPEDLYELIVVDNNSSDGTGEYLSGIAGTVKILTNEENLGFTIACNQGAREAQGDYVVFLNNDTIPLDGWLTALTDTFRLGEDIGAVGSKLIYPDMKLQEAGGIIFSDGNGWNFGRGDSPDQAQYNRLSEVDYCSGASLAVRRDLFEALGGFDEIYAPAYYEDTDLCFSLRERGYRVLYQPASEVIHCEGRTAGTSTGSGFKKYQLINQEKFREKWAHRLKDQGPSPYRGAPKPFTADRTRRLAGYTHADRINTLAGAITGDSAEPVNFLIIDPFLPIYDKASGSFRLFQIVKILARTPNVHVTYIARNGGHGDRYVRLLSDMGVEVFHTDQEKLFAFDITVVKSPVNLKYILSQRRYQYAFLSFYEIAIQYLPEIRLYSPDTRIFIDTVDIHFLREMRQAELYQDDTLARKALDTKANELDIYQRADALITVTGQDADVIRPHVAGRPIFVIPNLHPVHPRGTGFQDRCGIVFIGNYKHLPNVDAVEYYLKDIHPIIAKKGRSIPVSIIGDGLPEQVKKLGRKGITFAGWVPETAPYLERARISMAPLRYGAGMKGKVGEALAAGLPVVTTPIGAEGMGLTHEHDVMIAHSAEEFADMLIRLHEDSSLWERLSANGVRFIEEHYSIDAVARQVREIFSLSAGADVFEDQVQEKRHRLTSIIIPCFNQLEYTKKTLQSIEKHTGEPHELLLVDNGSTDGTRKYLKAYAEGHGHVQLICNDTNLGFAAANNQALQQASGDYILLMNNDVVVSPRWLEMLTGHLEQSPDIGMVGPMSNSVSGPQLVQKVPYGKSMKAMERFAEDLASSNRGMTSEYMRLVGFCLLMKREVIDIIGGLDENYSSGNYEDDDLCLRSFIAGYKNIIAHDVFIHHFGSMTFKGSGIDYGATMKVNLEYFAGKWKDLVEVRGNGYQVRMTKEQQLSTLLDWGEERFSGGDVKSSIKIFQRVFHLDRANSRALNNLGVIQWQLGDALSAMKVFQRALKVNPKDQDALGNLLQAATETGRFDVLEPNLLDTLKKAQPENPDIARLIEGFMERA